MIKKLIKKQSEKATKKFGIISLFAAILLISSLNVNGQAVGDYGAVASGAWTNPAIWKTYNGVSWGTSVAAGAWPNSSVTNVWILAGSTVTNTTSPISINNLNVAATGWLYANNAGSNYYYYVYGNIVCDGKIGNGATFDGISFGIEGPTCTFSGTGFVDCSRVRKTLSVVPTTNFTIDININIRFGSGSQTQIYNGASGTTFNVTINAGRTVNVTGGAFVGNVAMDGLDGSNTVEYGGTYTINGTLLVSGTLYLTTDNVTRPCNFIIGSTGIVTTAYVIGNPSGAAKHTLTMNSGGLLQITVSNTASSTFLFPSNNVYNLNPGSTIEYNGAATQYVESAITYANLKLSGTSTKNAIGPLFINGNLDIISIPTNLVPFAASPLISIGGNWTNYGSLGFTEGLSTVTFNGTANQTILSQSGPEEYYNLKINNTGGKVILSGVTPTIVRVINQLDLTQGNILTSLLTGSYYVRIQNTATVINASDNSFVEGACGREAIAGSAINFNFPVGKSGRLRPTSIIGTPVAGHLMLAEYYPADPNVIGAVTSKAATLDHISRCEYWKIRDFGSSGQPYSVSLSWPTMSNCFIVNNLPNLRVTSWNTPTAALWNDLGNGGTTGTLAAGTVSTVAPFSFTGVVTFTLASVDFTNPLPIDLLSFNAKQNKETVDLDWVTATEINNDYFEIERSIDGIEFKELLRVDGSGTTSRTHEYGAVDTDPLPGLSYYRLRQIDFDGKYSVSDPVAINFSGEKTKLVLYPNPSADKVNILYPTNYSPKATLRFIDAQGRIIKEMMIVDRGNGVIELAIQDLPVGIYTATLTDGLYNSRVLFVKQ